MASKNRFAAGQRKIKLHNNATSKLPLRCQVPHCEEDFYVRYIPSDANGKFTRRCFPHYINPPQKGATKQSETRNLLQALKLI